MNSIVIKGRLTADPELKTTESNISVCTVKVAVDRSYSKDGNRQTDFFACVFWRGTAEFVSKYFSKGQEILISGEMQSRKYNDKEGNSRTVWELVARAAEFCGSKNSSGQQENTHTEPQRTQNDYIDITNDEENFDLPF